MTTTAADIHQAAGGKSLTEVSGSDFSLLQSSEIDQQIATAHKYPRSIKRFRDHTTQLVTLNESVAGECIYSLPRAGSNIEGPSARFAEIIINTWGNCRSGARVIDESRDFVTAQGVFHDLESNSVINYNVQRRITDKRGKRFNADLIGVTSNAACSIALRNSALKGIPKAFWSDMYEAARKTVMGDIETLANRRQKMLHFMQRYGVTSEIVLAYVNRAGTEDITLEDMVTLRGLSVTLKDGETTLEKIQAELNTGSGSPAAPANFDPAVHAVLNAATAAAEPATAAQPVTAAKPVTAAAALPEGIEPGTQEIDF